MKAKRGTAKRKPTPQKIGFEAALIVGHKQVHAVIVPFDPEQVWEATPIAIDPRRDGWLVRGTANGVAFDGWIGHRWGKFFIILDAAVRRAAKAVRGEVVEMVVAPTARPEALAVAQEQAKLTTAPGRGKRRPRKAARPARRT